MKKVKHLRHYPIVATKANQIKPAFPKNTNKHKHVCDSMSAYLVPLHWLESIIHNTTT
uniref:Uncharacterized protein n=1 Tax=Arundo donax TaxID=35708 RepID=A0A0A9QNB1_ARUDO